MSRFRLPLICSFLSACALPLRIQSAPAPLAAQVKAFSHVPLSSDAHPRDVTDEEGFPSVGTRIMVSGDLDSLRELLSRISK